MKYPVRDPKKQPLKRKPLRGLPDLDSLKVWDPDIVRFKGQDTQWAVRSVGKDRIYLERYNSRREVVRKSITRNEEHRLEIVYQPPRAEDQKYATPTHAQMKAISNLSRQRPRSWS